MSRECEGGDIAIEGVMELGDTKCIHEEIKVDY